jgi:hypothetical protein
MGLGLQTNSSGGGEIIPRIQYDARAGRLHRIDRSQGAEGWVSDATEIDFPAQMVFDMDTIEVGWILIGNGAVDFKMVPLGEPMPPKPTDQHKQGFRVRVYSQKLLAGVRIWNGTAKCVIAAVDALHNEYVDQQPHNRGKVPVVEWRKPMAIKSGSGANTSTNYQPVLTIVKWIDRPQDFPAASAANTQVKPASTPPATGSGHVPPPGAAQQPAAQAAGAEF